MPRGVNDRGRPSRGGRGRGGGRGARGRGRSERGRGRGSVPDNAMLDAFDFPIQQWSHPDEIQRTCACCLSTIAIVEPGISLVDLSRQQGYRGRGRGGAGSPAHINSGATTPRRARGGMPDHSPRGARGRGDGFDYNSSRSGRGRGAAKLPLNTPLSKLLYQERPYLKPIIFVPSVFTRKLFEEEEDLVKPQVIDPGKSLLAFMADILNPHVYLSHHRGYRGQPCPDGGPCRPHI